MAEVAAAFRPARFKGRTAESGFPAPVGHTGQNTPSKTASIDLCGAGLTDDKELVCPRCRSVHIIMLEGRFGDGVERVTLDPDESLWLCNGCGERWGAMRNGEPA
jgi:hypothetical protein